jgi:hypothetical protein
MEKTQNHLSNLRFKVRTETFALISLWLFTAQGKAATFFALVAALEQLSLIIASISRFV